MQLLSYVAIEKLAKGPDPVAKLCPHLEMSQGTAPSC
jgi:hypothetical protein